jgi:hypothetical protein
MRPLTRIGTIVLGLLAAAAPAASVQANEDAWQFDATIYAWVPGISGETRFPTGAAGPTIDVSARDVLRSLDMAFMGTLEARRGRWGGIADWVYSDLSGQRTGTRDLSIGGAPVAVGVSADLGLRVKTNVVTLAGSYALIESPTYTTQLVAGTRMLKTDQTLNWSLAGTGSVPGLAMSGVVEASTTNWDAIVGVRGRARPDGNSRWFVPYYLDIGTGDSRRTWQSVIGVGYSFDAGDAVLAWRYLDYKFEPSEALQSLTFNGLAVGFTFHF